METGKSAEHNICMTVRCRRKYDKASKRMDPRLRAIVESEVDALRHDPRRGSDLEWNLAGLRSIHIDEFAYRIVYKADSASSTITIIAIDHRSGIYDELARLQGGL